MQFSKIFHSNIDIMNKNWFAWFSMTALLFLWSFNPVTEITRIWPRHRHPSQPMTMLHTSGQGVRTHLKSKASMATTTITSIKELKTHTPTLTRPVEIPNLTASRKPVTSTLSLQLIPQLYSTHPSVPRTILKRELIPSAAQMTHASSIRPKLNISMSQAVLMLTMRWRIMLSTCQKDTLTFCRGEPSLIPTFHVGWVLTSNVLWFI